MQEGRGAGRSEGRQGSDRPLCRGCRHSVLLMGGTWSSTCFVLAVEALLDRMSCLHDGRPKLTSRRASDTSGCKALLLLYGSREAGQGPKVEGAQLLHQHILFRLLNLVAGSQRRKTTGAH